MDSPTRSAAAAARATAAAAATANGTGAGATAAAIMAAGNKSSAPTGGDRDNDRLKEKSKSSTVSKKSSVATGDGAAAIELPSLLMATVPAAGTNPGPSFTPDQLRDRTESDHCANVNQDTPAETMVLAQSNWSIPPREPTTRKFDIDSIDTK